MTVTINRSEARNAVNQFVSEGIAEAMGELNPILKSVSLF